MTVHIQIRGDTAANWAAANPVLADREPGLSTDTSSLKFGDGVTAWNALPFWPAAAGGVSDHGLLDGLADDDHAQYANASRFAVWLAAAVGSVTQAWSATLDALAALTTTAFGRGLLTLSDAAALRTAQSLPISTTAGRLARYTGTAGEQGQTSGLYEDGTGNVGIGTTSPGRVLHVYDASGNPELQIADSTGGSSYQHSSGVLYINANDIGGFGTSQTIFRRGSGYSESMRIDGSGNVGIGTASPSNKLEVNVGDINIIGSGQAYRHGGNWLIGMSSTSAYVGGGLSGDLQLGANANGQVIIKNGGNVGIGTATPTAKLDVQGTILVNNEVQFTDAAMRIFRSSADMRFRAGSSDRMTINSTGNVGIGTTSPAVKLDVDGPIKCKSYTVATVPSAAAGAGQIIYVSDESGGAVLAFSDATNWRRVTDRAIIS